MHRLLYKAGCTSDPLIYKAKRKKKIKKIFKPAHNWIKNSLYNEDHQWALSKDGGRRFAIITMNCSESFDGVLKGARALLIQVLIARTFFFAWLLSFIPSRKGKEMKITLDTYKWGHLKISIQCCSMAFNTKFQHDWVGGVR